MTSTCSELAAERERAIASCLEDVRAILADAGVNRTALERIKARLLALAARRDLFSFAQFPLRHERSTMHVLAADDGDGRPSMPLPHGARAKTVLPLPARASSIGSSMRL